MWYLWVVNLKYTQVNRRWGFLGPPRYGSSFYTWVQFRHLPTPSWTLVKWQVFKIPESIYAMVSLLTPGSHQLISWHHDTPHGTYFKTKLCSVTWCWPVVNKPNDSHNFLSKLITLEGWRVTEKGKKLSHLLLFKIQHGSFKMMEQATWASLQIIDSSVL